MVTVGVSVMVFVRVLCVISFAKFYLLDFDFP